MSEQISTAPFKKRFFHYYGCKDTEIKRYDYGSRKKMFSTINIIKRCQTILVVQTMKHLLTTGTIMFYF